MSVESQGLGKRHRSSVLFEDTDFQTSWNQMGKPTRQREQVVRPGGVADKIKT